MKKDLLLKLSNSNQHLNNIFTENCYLELGNIEIGAFERIIKKELVPLKDITYFPIQNSGVGHSKLNDEYLRNTMPYIYFINVNRKNNNRQLFLTYGVVKYTKEKKDVFIPAVLIPVKLFFEQNEIFVQKMAKSFVNPHLVKLLSSRGIETQTLDEDTIYGIDHFTMQLLKYEGLNLELENYLTFGEVVNRDYIIDSNQFELNIEDDRFFDKMYLEGENVYFVNILNKKQRKAVYASKLGKSFTIVGKNGTGKTLALKNILLNAMYDNKVTLYLSNMKSTLDNVEAFLIKEGLGNNVANLSNSYMSLINEEVIDKKIEHVDVDYDKLLEDYQYVNQIEERLGGRVLDHRFIEVIDEIIGLISKKPKIIEVDDLSSIYKNEYIEIVNALKQIEEALAMMGVFNDSNWKSIPRNSTISDSKMIMTLIKRIYECFVIFRKEKKALEEKFLTIKINDYAMLRKVVGNIEALDIRQVPVSWKESSLASFRKAQNEFKRLKSNVSSYQDINLELNQIFTNYDLFNINEEINEIMGKYYTRNDLDLIDELFSNRNDIMVRVLDGNEQIANFQKSVASFEKISGYNFGKNNDSINEILKLMTFLDSHETNYNIIMAINNNGYDDYYKKVENALTEINDATSYIKDFTTNYPKVVGMKAKDILSLIEEYLQSNEKKVKKALASVLKKYFGRGNLDEQITHVKKYFSDIQKLRVRKEEYADLTLEKYRPNNDILEKISDWKGYYDSIPTKTYQKAILKILIKLSEKDNQSITKSLNNFRRTYYGLEDLALLISSYRITLSKDFNKKIEEITEVLEYLRNLYASNDRIKKIVKKKEGYFVSSKTYFFLKESLAKRENLKKHFDNNLEYEKLFGSHYKGEKTDIVHLSDLIDSYNDFVETFVSAKGFLDALKNETYENILTHIEKCKKTGDEINEIFKAYSHIFIDGVSRYYYNDIEDNLKYLDTLLKSQDELELYLHATHGLSVLSGYNLTKLIEYACGCRNGENLVIDFQYTYFKNIEKLYFEKYPELENSDEFLNRISEIYKIEENLVKSNEEKLLAKIKRDSSRNYGNGRKIIDYGEYVRRSGKQVFLASSDISNLYLDKNEFDLVIIDDAHLLPSSAYGDFILAKQVIISGEKPTHTSVINNLISKTRQAATIPFEYRYTQMPKNLQSKALNISGLIPKTYQDNCGVEVLKNNVSKYIYDSYKRNCNNKVNVFIKRLSKQREFIEDLASYFLSKGISDNEIISLLLTKINVCDLASGYFYDSDYNVIFLEDYYNIDIDYISDNLINSLIVVKSKVVIFDDSKILDGDYKYRFFLGIKKLLDCENNLPEIITSQTMEKIASRLEGDGFKVSSSPNSVVYRYNDATIQANVVLWSNNSTIESMNIYRDVYMNHLNNGFDTKIVSKISLAKDYERMLDEMKRGKNVQKRK